MLRETRKQLRRMLNISDQPDMVIAPKVDAALDDMELLLARVSRQHGITNEGLAGLLAAMGGERVMRRVEGGAPVSVQKAPNATSIFRDIKVHHLVHVLYDNVDREGRFMEVLEEDGKEMVRVQLKGDTAKFRVVPAGDVRLKE